VPIFDLNIRNMDMFSNYFQKPEGICKNNKNVNTCIQEYKDDMHKWGRSFKLGFQELDNGTVTRSLLAEQVYKTIKNAIMNGEISAGQRLKEVELAESLNVSRTPVRQALNMLKLEGFVVNLAGGGVKVIEVTRDEANKIFDLRVLLETFAAEKAVENILETDISKLEELLIESDFLVKQGLYKKLVSVNTQFHDVISAASANSKLFDILGSIKEHLAFYREVSVSDQSAKASLEGHRRILEELKNRDEKAISFIMKDHLEEAREILLSRLP